MGNLTTPTDVYVHNDGTNEYVYVVSSGSDEFQVFDLAGTYVTAYGSNGAGDGQFDTPYGIKVYEDEIYVTDQVNNRCQVFNLSGVYQRQWAVTTPYGIEVYNDEVYIATGDTIEVYNKTGTLLRTLGSTGTSNGQFDTIKGIRIYDGRLYVVDSANSRVQRLSLFGVFEKKWGSVGTGNGQFTGPDGIWADGNGVFVSDDDRVQQFTTDGVFKGKFGSLGSGNDQLDEPKGLMIYSGNDRMYIADSANNRISYYDLTSSSRTEAVNCLIPEDGGIAISKGVFNRDILVSPVVTTGNVDLTGSYRPQWAKFEDKIIVVDGGLPVKKVGSKTSLLGGSPPKARFIGRVGSYTLLAGHHDTEWYWSASNNPENYVDGDSGFANCKPDGIIMFATDFEEKWFIFKDNSIEVWMNRGGSTPFVRLNELGIEKGLLASYSAVKANNTIYWLGDDYHFYILNNFVAETISNEYQEYIFDNLLSPSEVFGFDCRKEACIRWLSPSQGLCFKYDYKNGVFSEDNKWISGAWQRLPWNSYMEMSGKQYFGDYNPTGKVYEWSKDYKDDNGDPIRCYRRFAIRLTENGNNARVNNVRFKVKRGIATSSVESPVFSMRHKYDNGQWQRWQQIDLGKIGDYDTNIDVTVFNGIGREITFELSMTDNTDFLLMNMYLTAKELNR